MSFEFYSIQKVWKITQVVWQTHGPAGGFRFAGGTHQGWPQTTWASVPFQRWARCCLPPAWLSKKKNARAWVAYHSTHLLIVLKPGKSKIRHLRTRCLGKAFFRFFDICLPIVSSQDNRARYSLIRRTPPSWPNHLPKPHFQILSCWALGFNMNLEGELWTFSPEHRHSWHCGIITSKAGAPTTQV